MSITFNAKTYEYSTLLPEIKFKSIDKSQLYNKRVQSTPNHAGRLSGPKNCRVGTV